MDQNNTAIVLTIISTVCLHEQCVFESYAVCMCKTQPNTTQNTLPKNKSERETEDMGLVCAERWISELGSLNGAGLGEEY